MHGVYCLLANKKPLFHNLHCLQLLDESPVGGKYKLLYRSLLHDAIAYLSVLV